MDSRKIVQARAEAKFKKAEEQSRHSQAIAAEEAAKARAVDANTARLKGLRLEKERADREWLPRNPHARRRRLLPRNLERAHCRAALVSHPYAPFGPAPEAAVDVLQHLAQHDNRL